MCRGVVFVGSREGVGAERGGEGVVVLAEGERSGAGADARLGIGLFELFDDGGFERRAPDLRSDVASFELDARTRVVPRSGKSILGQLAVGGFVGGRRGGFFRASFQSCAEEVVPPSRSRDAVNNRSFFIGSML